MRLLILGKSPSWPDAGGACSGYLVQEDGFSLLLDCGSGVLGKLRAELDYLALDAVLISHLHADHIIDLVPFSYALGLSPRQGQTPRRPPLHAPPGARARFRELSGCWKNERLIEDAFALSEYDPSAGAELGPFSVRFCEVPHYTQTFAVELGAGGRRLTFGADCGPNEALVEFAQGTDLLIAEASLTEPDTDDPRGHMTPAEAGEMGRLANAGRLMVSHYTDELDRDWVRSEATRGYGGEVILAETGAEHII